MSKEMQVLVKNMKQMTNGMFSQSKIDVQACREFLAHSYANQPKIPNVEVTESKLNNIPIGICTPKYLAGQDSIYYVHGGGLITGDEKTAVVYAAQLALVSGLRVIAGSYRLAPEHKYPASLDDTVAIYQGIREQYPDSQIAAIGESGGAYLSLALAVYCKMRNLPQSTCLVLNSVVADFSAKLPLPAAPHDYVVSVAGLKSLAKMYAKLEDIDNPLVSLINADYKGLCPMRLTYDVHECLEPDSRFVIKQCIENNVPVESAAYHDFFHAFAAAGLGTPESKVELSMSIKFMQEHFAH